MANNPKGWDDVMKQLQTMPTTLAYGLRMGLEEAALLVQTEAKRRCPRSPEQAEIDDQMRRRHDDKQKRIKHVKKLNQSAKRLAKKLRKERKAEVKAAKDRSKKRRS